MKSNRAVADWETRELSQIARIETGGTPPTSDRSLYGNDFPFASPADIGAQRWIASTEKNLSSAGWSHVRRLPAGAILVVCIGSTIGKVGMAAVPMATNQQINAVIPSDKIDRDFLYYSLCLSADEIRGQASEQAVPIINKSTFGRLSIFIPPLNEQQAIAAALSDADGVVAGLERVIAKKRRIKQGAMQDLLTACRRLPGFSGEWEVKKLGEVSKFLSGSYLAKEDYRPGGVSVEGAGNTMGEHDEANFPFAISVLGRVGTVGRPRFMPNGCWVNNNAAALRALPGAADPFFIHLLLSQYDWAAATSITAQPFLVVPTLMGMEHRLPPLEEQQAITAVLYDMDTEIQTLESRLAKARAVKEGMMQNLLTGRVRLV